MEHIHDLSAKLQKGDFAYLGGVFGDGLALFRFEQAVLGFTQFDTGQVAQFIAVDRNPVVFLCRDQVLFFPGSTSPGCCDKPSRSCSYRLAIPVRVLVCAILGSESVSGHSVVRVSG